MLNQFLKSFGVKNAANVDVFGASQAQNQGILTVVVVVVVVVVAGVVVVVVAVVVVVVVVVVGRHKNRAPVETTRNSLEDEMTKPPWTSVVRVCF